QRFTLLRSPLPLLPLPPLDSPRWHGSLRAFAWGMSSTASTILSLVLFVTYIGIGALAHDTHFSLAWALLGTALVWAGPAHIILITTLASGPGLWRGARSRPGAAPGCCAVAVALRAMRRACAPRRPPLVLTARFPAVTLWVECYRFLPLVPRKRRVAFVHGLGCGLLGIGLC